MPADIAALLDVVPGGGMADVVDRDVVVLAPKERHHSIALAAAEQVARGRLPLPLGDDPVLDAQLLAAIWVRPAGNIASGENAWHACFEVLVDHHAAIDRQPSVAREIDARPYADPDHDELGIERGAVVEPDPVGLDRGERAAEMKDDTMRLVQGAHEIAERRSEHPLHRPRLGCNDMDLNLAVPQGGGRFEPDEAGADDDGAASFPGTRDQLAAVSKRP